MYRSVSDRNKMVEENYGLVVYAANHFKKIYPYVDYDDLCSTMNEAIVRAAASYCLNNSNSFATYFMKIATNECVSLVRIRVKEVKCDKALDDALRHSFSVDEDSGRFEDTVLSSVCLETAIKKLKGVRNQCIVRDRVVHGEKYDVISRRYNISITGARKKVLAFADTYGRCV